MPEAAVELVHKTRANGESFRVANAADKRRAETVHKTSVSGRRRVYRTARSPHSIKLDFFNS